MTLGGTTNEFEVIVIGGGLAGMATSIHLARAGMDVVCIDAVSTHSDPVGESLDWSAPDLLHALGLPVAELIDRKIATIKRHVTLRLLDGAERHYTPGEWLAREPFNVVLDTIHVDRSALADAIREIAQQEKIRIVADQVLDVQHASGQRVLWVTTRQGQQLRARWFVDASGGRSRLFARAFDLPAHDYGPSKVAMWDYFPTSAPVIAGTTLYGSASSSTYMDWIWQIPIQPDLMSVGCVATGETMKALRQTGLSVQQIYEARLREFPDLVPLLQHEEPISPRVTSFRCRVHEKVRGPNWLIVGEAASMVDPMTSNGVTAALRHASEAAILIANSRNASRLPRLDSAAYAWRVRDMASFFNSLIERIMYETPIRARFGALAAGDCYTIPAWLMNLFYSRTRPNGIVGSLCFGTVLRFLRCSAAALSWFCRGTRPKSGSGQLSAG